MKVVKTVCKFLCLLGATTIASVSLAEAVTYSDHPETKAFIAEMVERHGFEKDKLEQLFSEVKFKKNIIKLMTSPAEAKPWKDYRPILVTQQRAKQGQAFYRENRVALERAESLYGVPAEIIVAVIGVETRYGRITGSFRVVDALSTLAFDYPRRAKFFRKELSEFLVLARDERVDPTSLKGSYAGAMGYGQFMPSSFRAYAIDFDGDGRRDIWNNPTDAIGSVANYFHQHGWKKNAVVTQRATAKGNDYHQLLVKKRKDLIPKYKLTQLIEAGFEPTRTLEPDQMATAMLLDGAEGEEYWVGLHNFYVITRYNQSSLYAMAVYQLSLEIAESNALGG